MLPGVHSYECTERLGMKKMWALSWLYVTGQASRRASISSFVKLGCLYEPEYPLLKILVIKILQLDMSDLGVGGYGSVD